MTTLVTGGTGMIGTNIKDMIDVKVSDFVFLSSKDGDLRCLDKVKLIFERYKPKFVIHLAANVGGLYKNMNHNVEMFRDNIRINENVLQCCNESDVQKGIFCLSSCIYPVSPSKFPMDETMIHESPPHYSNEGYAYAKRMLEVQCRNYNNQYGRQYICVVPVNLYGKYDNFNLEDSHVIPGLIHRMYISKQNNLDFKMFGTGKPLRQFLYASDFAEAILLILKSYEDKKTIIISTPEIEINDVCLMIADILKYEKKNITNDLSKSDGCLKKTVSNEYFKQLYPDFNFTQINQGLEETIRWFLNNYSEIRK